METMKDLEVVDLREMELGEQLWLENCSMIFPRNFEGVKHISLVNITMLRESVLFWNLTDLLESYDDLEAALRVLNTTLHFLQLKPIDTDDFLDLVQLLELKIKGKKANDPELDIVLEKLVKRKHQLNDFPDIFPENLEILDLSDNGINRLPDSVLGVPLTLAASIRC